MISKILSPINKVNKNLNAKKKDNFILPLMAEY